MTKTALKKLVNEKFGFSEKKIVLLESSNKGPFIEYVMFRVCEIEYQMFFDFDKGEYVLKIYESHGLIEKEF